MELDNLWKKFWNDADKGETEKLLVWINKLKAKNENNLDIRYIYLEVLRWNHLDVEDDQEEPLVMRLCTEIIKDKENQSPITVAKAFAYRGEMKYLAIDRRKDFTKALNILDNIGEKTKEIQFLRIFLKNQYPLEFRQYLPIDTDYRNLFKF